MKTIEQHNKIAQDNEVMMFSFKHHIPQWDKSGIMCPCGCKKELLRERYPLSFGKGWPIKCPKSSKEGIMIFSDSLREIIKEIKFTENSDVGRI